MSDNGEDSPWSSEQEESLSGSEALPSESSSSSSSSSSESEDGFFIDPRHAASADFGCPIEIAPVNTTVSRKTKTLHIQLFELSEALFYIDRPYMSGRYFAASGRTVWQTAVKALIALDLPRKGHVIEENGIKMAAKKAMAWNYRRLIDIKSRFHNDAEYREGLSGAEARAHVQFFTTMDRCAKSDGWRNICAYEARYPVPKSLLSLGYVDIQQRVLRLLLHQALGGPHSQVLDLSDLVLANEIPDLLNEFPWSRCMRWLSDVPSRGILNTITEGSESTAVSLYDKQRLAVHFLDLTGNDMAGAPNVLFGTFTNLRCIAGDFDFGPALQACELLDHRHLAAAPEAWSRDPPAPKTYKDAIARQRLRSYPYYPFADRYQGMLLSAARHHALLDRAMSLENGDLGLIRSRRHNASGPVSLMETIKLSILTQIEPDFFWRNQALQVGQIADALGADIVAEPLRRSVFTSLNDLQKATVLGSAPEHLPSHLWEAFLTSYMCGLCFRLVSSGGRSVYFSVEKPAHSNLPRGATIRIVAQACSDCVVRPLPDQA